MKDFWKNKKFKKTENPKKTSDVYVDPINDNEPIVDPKNNLESIPNRIKKVKKQIHKDRLDDFQLEKEEILDKLPESVKNTEVVKNPQFIDTLKRYYAKITNHIQG